MASSLQRALSTLATKHQFDASLSAARGRRSRDGGASLAHALAVSARRACAWKSVVPSTEELQLTDVQYRLAARLNLGLQPMAEGALPSACPSCETHNSLSAEPWHFLTCKKENKGEIELRHNAVVDAIYRTVLAVGGEAMREPKSLETTDGRRPDLKLMIGLQKVLVDVVVSHPLTPAYIRMNACKVLGVAKMRQQAKHHKYDRTAARHHAQMLAFSVETCGGMGARCRDAAAPGGKARGRAAGPVAERGGHEAAGRRCVHRHSARQRHVVPVWSHQGDDGERGGGRQ